VKHCILIPCYNHSTTVAAVVRAAQAHGPVLLVDDGSTDSLPPLPDVTVIRLDKNGGKGGALRAGFEQAARLGYTHAITMDADGQHFADDLPKFIAAAQAQPDALIVGVRDFLAAGCPTHRRRSNAVSSFWFRVESGVRLPDTQCGFRCYPLALTQRLKARSQRYAFELEFMVRASWSGVALVPVPVSCSYEPEQIRRSHFRPVVDLERITRMNIGLVLQSWFVPRVVRIAWSRGEQFSIAQTTRLIFSDHARNPSELARAVGLGIFCGIVPLWGFQMLIAAALAHWLRLNKAITLVASNISIPPMVPFILYGGLALGHRLFTGQALEFSPSQMTRARAMEYLWQWALGSVLLAVLAGALGGMITYGLARATRRR
jgi:uncharacterized protein (DUF2062 family)